MSDSYMLIIKLNNEIKVRQYCRYVEKMEYDVNALVGYLREMDIDYLKERLSHCSFAANEFITQKFIECGGRADGAIKLEDLRLWDQKYLEYSSNTGVHIIPIIYNSKDDLLLRDFESDESDSDYAIVIDFDTGLFKIFSIEE